MLKLEKTRMAAIMCVSFFCLIILAPPMEGTCQQRFKGEWAMPEGYPLNGFDGWGRIDRISDDALVMDDTVYKLAASVKFHTRNADDVPSSWFKKGDLAGFLKNDAGEVISIWRIGD